MRLSLRMLCKNRGLTIMAVATLALSIGATTALFSVVNAALLRGLPYPDADRLIILRETTPEGRPCEALADVVNVYRDQRRSAGLAMLATLGSRFLFFRLVP